MMRDNKLNNMEGEIAKTKSLVFLHNIFSLLPILSKLFTPIGIKLRIRLMLVNISGIYLCLV